MVTDEYKTRVYEALDKAVAQTYGNGLAHYTTPLRRRDVLDVRNMSMHIYYHETRATLSQMERLFHRHHATILYAMSQVDTLRKSLKPYDSEYKNLHQKFIDLL